MATEISQMMFTNHETLSSIVTLSLCAFDHLNFKLLPPNFTGEPVKVGYEKGVRCSLKGDILAQVYSTQIL